MYNNNANLLNWPLGPHPLWQWVLFPCKNTWASSFLYKNASAVLQVEEAVNNNRIKWLREPLKPVFNLLLTSTSATSKDIQQRFKSYRRSAANERVQVRRWALSHHPEVLLHRRGVCSKASVFRMGRSVEGGPYDSSHEGKRAAQRWFGEKEQTTAGLRLRGCGDLI